MGAFGASSGSTFTREVRAAERGERLPASGLQRFERAAATAFFATTLNTNCCLGPVLLWLSGTCVHSERSAQCWLWKKNV